MADRPLYPPLNDAVLEGDVLTMGPDGRPMRGLNRFSKTWQQFFAWFKSSASHGIAPSDADYVLTSANAGLPNGRVIVPTATVDVDTSTAGQIALNVPDHAITYAKLQQVSAVSRLLGGADSSSPSTVREISLGPGLIMVGTVLVLTGTGPTLVPVTTGEEPPVLVTDGAGGIIYVPFNL